MVALAEVVYAFIVALYLYVYKGKNIIIINTSHKSILLRIYGYKLRNHPKITTFNDSCDIEKHLTTVLLLTHTRTSLSPALLFRDTVASLRLSVLPIVTLTAVQILCSCTRGDREQAEIKCI